MRIISKAKYNSHTETLFKRHQLLTIEDIHISKKLCFYYHFENNNLPTRYLTNDACVLQGKPNVYGSIFRFDGQASVFAPSMDGPCYRCLYPEPPPPGMVPSCAEGGVLGVLPGIVGCIQATEIIKLALGEGSSLENAPTVVEQEGGRGRPPRRRGPGRFYRGRPPGRRSS